MRIPHWIITIALIVGMSAVVYDLHAKDMTPVPTLPDRNPMRPDTRPCIAIEKLMPVIEKFAEGAVRISEEYNGKPYTPRERNGHIMSIVASTFKLMVENGTYRFRMTEEQCKEEVTR